MSLSDLQARIEAEVLSVISRPADVDRLDLSTDLLFVKHLDDEKAKAIRRFFALRAIVQDGNNRITDEGVRCLSMIHSLEWLDLEWGGAITDDALEYISGLSHLKWLDIDFCVNLTPKGLYRLRQRLPNLKLSIDP